jgi:enamine deaminase RidA (YjgF/YER057c/UK114 family)
MNDGRTSVSSGSPFEAQIGFTRGVRVGNLAAISGTAPIGEDGMTAGVGDVRAQTRRCLELIQVAIEGLGGSLADVFRTRIYLTDSSVWPEAAEVHCEFFGAIRPASTCVEVSALLNPDWLVEIEADAWIPSEPAPVD